MGKQATAQRISKLNDQLRKTGLGGQLVITIGVQALGSNAIAGLLREIAAYNDFSEDNDPLGEHDFGIIEGTNGRFLWKIDYYDTDLRFLSPNPADPAITRRVMTVMRSEEY